MASPTIRRGQLSDVSAMYALDLLCFEPPFRFSLGAMRRFATQANAIVLVAEEEAKALCGFVILHTERRGAIQSAYVTTLDVASSRRRCGVGRQLMVEAEGASIGAGASCVWLHVFTGNQAAIHFYERCGYEPRARVPSFYGEGQAALIYSKELTGVEALRV